MSSEYIITSDACVAEGAAWLATHEPRFAYALEQCGPIPLRLRGDGFQALLSAIVSQQISVAAANGIWKPLHAAKACSKAGIDRHSDEELRACGLSRSKVRYARALAISGLSYRALRTLPTEHVIAELTQITGIGRWTAEIYAALSLGRADVLPAGDLALQESAKQLFELDNRPTETQFRALGATWSPWKSVAARILWSYYRVLKGREGLQKG